MSSAVLVIAPHPDDETLGCGGAIARYKRLGDRVELLLVTAVKAHDEASAREAALRAQQVESVAETLGLDAVHRLGLPTAELDRHPLGDLVARISALVARLSPAVVYLPFPGDAHSDHEVVFKAATAAVKGFRAPSVRSVRLYETLSETNFAMNPCASPFRPNLYIDISRELDRKIEALQLYAGELAAHPFPRSVDAVRALAVLRGSEAGVPAAEAFMVIKAIER